MDQPHLVVQCPLLTRCLCSENTAIRISFVQERVKSASHPAGLTPKQAAARLGVAVCTLAYWRKHKRAPSYVKLGGRIYYPEREIVSALSPQPIVEQSL